MKQNLHMKNLTLLIATLTLVAATGCSTATKTRQTTPFPTVIQPAPIKVDYEVNTREKKTGAAASSYLLGFIKTSGPSVFAENADGDARGSLLGGRINRLRLAAVHNALKDGSADRLLDPQYDCQVITYPFGIFKRYIVTVKGYEATVRDIQPAKN